MLYILNRVRDDDDDDDDDERHESESIRVIHKSM